MLLTLLALGIAPVHAFAPTESPSMPSRTLPYNAGIQTRLRHSAGWQSFLQGEGAGWYARFDEKQGTPVGAYGPSIDLGALPNEAAVETAVRAFLSRNPGLTGVGQKELRTGEIRYVASRDTWFVHLDRLVNGVPVWRGGVDVQIRGNRLMEFSVNTYPGFDVGVGTEVTKEQAFELAAEAGPVGLGARKDLDAELVVLPREDHGRLELKAVWMVRSASSNPVGRFVGFVDAIHGEVLAWYNEIPFFAGTMYGTVDNRYVGNGYTNLPMPLLTIVEADGSTTDTDASGKFSISEGKAEAEFSGSYLTIDNQDGGNGSISFSSGNPTWTANDATQAEIDTWVFVHQVRDWGLLVAPEVKMSSDALTTYVNQPDICNAYYDGNLNFFQAGSAQGYSCNNTGQIADVVYHEWGHGFHFYSIGRNDYPDGTVGEAVGDTVAFFNTLDHKVGPNFFTDGSPVRDVGPDHVYPGDVVGEPHEDGLIFGGAVWDLLGLIETSANEKPYTSKGTGWRATVDTFVGAIKSNPTLETAFDDFLVADDDNNDLSDGTPHICEITEAFTAHGLGPSSSSPLLALDHLPLENQPANTPIPVAGSVLNLAPQCNAFNLANATIHYSTNNGKKWQEGSLTVKGDGFEGSLDGMDPGTIVMYWLEAVSDDGTTVTLPPGGEIAPYTFYVGELKEVYCQQFGRDDGGFTHELLAGKDQEGADDWMFGTPGGLSNDPTVAFSGSGVWGNDLGGGNYNGAYQSSITNRLSSIPIETGGATTLILQYRRWLNVEDGYYDHARVYANDAEIWTNHVGPNDRAGEATQDVDWVLHTLQIDSPASPLVLGWEIESDQGLELGGWNLDDVCVYTPVGEVPSVGVSDFSASDDQIQEVDLSWTQPLNAARAVVVRRDDRYPEDAGDGTVVFDGAVTGGEFTTQVDPFEGIGYYAVFVGNGDTLGSGATEGANADQGIGLNVDGGIPEDTAGGITLQAASCGCAAGETPTALGALVLAGLVLVRRRRE